MRATIAIVLAAGIAVAGVAPAEAGDTRPAADFSNAPPVRPAERGKPWIFTPPPVRTAPEPCLSPLPCGARVVGAIEKNGAVEVQVPAWRW